MDQKIIWSPKAASNLESICNFIGQDSIYYASLFAKRIVDIVETIPDFPKSGRMVPEYNDPNIRERFYKSYRIVYGMRSASIEIVAIAHCARLRDHCP